MESPFPWPGLMGEHSLAGDLQRLGLQPMMGGVCVCVCRMVLSLAHFAFELQTGIKLGAVGNRRGNPAGSGGAWAEANRRLSL